MNFSYKSIIILAIMYVFVKKKAIAVSDTVYVRIPVPGILTQIQQRFLEVEQSVHMIMLEYKVYQLLVLKIVQIKITKFVEEFLVLPQLLQP